MQLESLSYIAHVVNTVDGVMIIYYSDIYLIQDPGGYMCVHVYGALVNLPVIIVLCSKPQEPCD